MTGLILLRRTRRTWLSPVFALAMSFAIVPSAFALDPPPEPDDSITTAPLKAVRSIYDSMHKAISAYVAGDKAGAAKALEVAADQGHAPAHWKLARMYAEGDGVPQDDAKAFRHFSVVCDENADMTPDAPDARFVASSFVALGNYYLTGIAYASVKPNPVRSRELYTYAATYFGDPEAQFRLSGLFIEGIGGPSDPKQALRWLNLAAEKGHRLAQAKLGTLLFDGYSGTRQKARGLMWLSLAAEGADPAKEGWITELRDEAIGKSSDRDRLAADAFRAQFQNSRKK